MADEKTPETTDTPVTPSVPTDTSAVQYRQLDAVAIANEIARRAASLGRALRGYESAKAVSQETLDAPICV